MGEIGDGTGSAYPGALDTDAVPEVDSPSASKTLVRADVPNDLAAAAVAIETELGTDVAGSLTDLKTRLAVSLNDDGTLKGAGLTWKTQTANDTAVEGEGFFASTSGGVWTLTLPVAASIGDEIGIIDQDGTFATNNLTIGRNGLNIMGVAEDMVCRTNNLGFSLIYSGDATDGWRIK